MLIGKGELSKRKDALKFENIQTSGKNIGKSPSNAIIFRVSPSLSPS